MTFTAPAPAETAVLPDTPSPFREKRWTVRDMRHLVDTGLLDGNKVELIDGKVRFKVSQGRHHIAAVTRINAALGRIFDPESLQGQSPIGIGRLDEFNDPEPDVALLQKNVTEYLDTDPNPATDVLLVVEAAFTTLADDKKVKTPLYARHGVREYWILNIPARTLIVHRHPDGDDYREIITHDETESLAPMASPNTPVHVADLLP